MWTRFVWFLCCVFFHAAWAQTPSASFNTPQVRAELVWHAPQGVGQGAPIWLGLILRHQKDWHTYWKNPGDSGLPTALEWQLPAGVTVQDTLWPIPRKLRLGDLVNYGFEQTVALVTPLHIPDVTRPGADGLLTIGLTAHWLVCRTECIPQSGTFKVGIPWITPQSRYSPEVALTLDQQPAEFSGVANAHFENGQMVIQSSGWPPALQGQKIALYPEQNEVIAAAAETHPRARQAWADGVWSARLPLSDLRAQSPDSLTWWWVVGEGTQARAWRVRTPVQGPWPETSPSVAPAAAVSSAPGTDLGWWGALLGAFMGGLLLNLMPCVFPVLALKVFALGQGQLSPGMRRAQGWAYTAGVMLFLLGLGGLLIALRAAGQAVGWGFQLQSPWLVGALALLFALIALNLADLIHFDRWLPRGLGPWTARHPALDAFLTGLLSVVVAAPCSAPFMGASLGLAVTLPWPQAMAIFAMLGIGLASPYALATHAPSLARFLPRPGPWMNRLRHVLAIPMAATVLWLLWVLGQQVMVDPPSPETPSARADSPAGQWLPWTPDLVREAQAQGRPVFVDFTAAWCITCQVNKRATLDRAEVVQAFKAHDVLTLRADWTRYDPAITRALADLDRTGIPVYAIYRPGREPLVLSELISVADVLQALK